MDTEMATETRKQKLSETWCLDKEEGQKVPKFCCTQGAKMKQLVNIPGQCKSSCRHLSIAVNIDGLLHHHACPQKATYNVCLFSVCF